MTENKVTIDGVRYVAVDETDRCTGCAGGSDGSALCRSLPDCEACVREDGRGIVWQRAPSSPDELTALRELNRELLEALDDFVKVHEFLGHADRPHYRDAKRVIAKARGEA